LCLFSYGLDEIGFPDRGSFVVLLQLSDFGEDRLGLLITVEINEALQFKEQVADSD
jgi:hypothetical protein